MILVMGTLLRGMARARHGRRVLGVALICVVAFGGLLTATQRRSDAADFSDHELLPPAIRIVDIGMDQAEQVAAPLRAAGFGVDTYSPVALDATVSPGIWWITARAAERLSRDVIGDLRRSGSHLLLEGVGERVASEMKLRDVPGRSTTKSGRMNGVSLTWDPALPLRTPTVPGQSLATTDAKTPALFLTDDQTVMWALPVLSENPHQLPYLASVLREHWDLRPRVERTGFDMFVDPDDHPTLSSKELVQQLSDAGVRRIYLAGWKRNVATKFLFDYKKFVNEAHAVDLQVFAWVAWPYVDFSFWAEHPDCRERTGDGLAARVNWRELAAVELPECFDLAWDATHAVLKSADFDGTIISDLFFESPYFGYREPKYYTPFHPEVRRAYIDKFGYDPKSLIKSGSGHWKTHPKRLAQWETYRTDLLVSVYDKLLNHLEETFPNRTTVVSVMDDRVDKVTGALLASNSGQQTEKILSLRNKFQFELQVGDSFSFRNVDVQGVPDQYPVRRNEPIVGVNTDGRPVTSSATSRGDSAIRQAVTSRPLGLELNQLVGLAARANPVVTISGSHLSLANDLPWVRHALAGANTTVIEVGPLIETTSDQSFRLLLNNKAARLKLDGRPIRAGAFVDVPAGSHEIEVGQESVATADRSEEGSVGDSGVSTQINPVTAAIHPRESTS